MKKHKLIYSILLFAVTLLAMIAISCGDGNILPEKKEEGPETGVYYYVADDVEYLLALNSGDVVTVLTAETSKVGSYSVSQDKLTINIGDNQYTATLNGNVLILNYGDMSVRFVKKITYTVKFDSNGGSAVDSVSVINGKTVAAPEVPTKNGYEFIGWYKDDNYSTPFVFGSDIVTDDITLYARWVEPVFGKMSFTVKFDLNYETDQTIESKATLGGKLYDVVTPERDGYIFKGWWVSMSADKTKLSYKVTSDTVFNENTTVYALWQSQNASGNKPAMPVVDIAADNVSWDSINNVQKYHIEITGPSGFVSISKDTGSTNEKVDFGNSPAGDYVITVTAIAGNGTSSDPAVRYYTNKALARVSMFTVVEPSTLIFNAVEGAEKYLIDVECGDNNHKHTGYDNGLSTSFNFVNCLMKEGGIKFKVTAIATGKASSVSQQYTYNERILEAVKGLRYNSATEEVAWESVANAAGYNVILSCSTDGHDHNVKIEVGNRTSVSLKNFDPCTGKINVKVIPVTKGYNAAAASEIDIEKKTLAAPSNIRILGDKLLWDEVSNATSYEISIGSRIYSSDTNEFDLTTAENTTWEEEADYSIRIMAASTGKNSLWCDSFDARYYAMYSSVSYNAGEVSWRHVIGVQKYNVRVNDGETIVIENGTNKTEVKLTKAGTNTIYVNYVDSQNKASEWYSVDVYAHEITFDTRGGTGEADSQYYAVGDKLYLPTAADLEKNGYEFAGWYTTPLGGAGLGALYNDTHFSGAGGFVLYAYWTPEEYTITLDGNGGTVEDNQETTTVSYLSNNYTWPVVTPSDSSLVFAGWFSDKNGLEIQYTDETGKAVRPWLVTRGMTVYACWNSIFEFEKLPNGTYRVSKNAKLFHLAPADLTIPATYQHPVNDSKPINVTEIGSVSFTSCSGLITVNIPNSIRYIDSGAFKSSNNLTEFKMYEVEGAKLPEYCVHDGVLYHKTYTDFGDVSSMELLIYPVGKNGPHAILSGTTILVLDRLNSSKVTKLTIPSSVTVIERHAIYNCSQLEEIEFEEAGNVTEDGKVKALNISNEAIANCSKLKTVKLPARLEKFSPTIFYSCAAFAEIKIEVGSKNYSDKDGLLCDVSGKEILYCPPAAVVGSFTLPTGITTIGERAFASNTKITEIVFPMWAREIKTSGFSGCSYLTTVIFEEDAIVDFTIGDNAFEKCSRLKDIIFKSGSKVKTIGNNAFDGCYAIVDLDLPDTLETIGDYAFQGCTKIETLRLPKNLTSIGEYAFSKCTKINEIIFAENGEDIELGDYAFNGCTALTEVDIPENVVVIGEAVFAGCTKLTTINVDEDNENYQTWMGVLFTKGFETMLFFPLGKTDGFEFPEQVKSLGAALFKGNTSLQSITIGKNIKSIGAEAFMNCTGLNTVIFELGDGEDLELGASVFEGCTNLKTVQMTNRIKEIPNRLFYNDKLIETFNMPEYITSIGENAFYYCSGITSLTIPATVSNIGYGAFRYCTGLKTVTFDNPPEDNDEESDEDSDIVYATTLTLDENASFVTDTFYNCTALGTVNIPLRMTSIGNSMFYNCSGLTEIYIPNTVSFIGSKAFYGCSTLGTVEFEEGNTSNTLEICEAVSGTTPSVSTGAFSGCTLLSDINLPARIEYIPAYTFYNCKSLLNITIPNTVKNKYDNDGKITSYAVRKYAFYNCTGLKTITFADGNANLVTIDEYAFNFCSKLETLNLPKGLTYIVKKSDSGEDISDHYDVFGTNALNGCSVFKTINVEEGGKYYSVDGILYYTETLTDEEDNEYTVKEVVFCPQTRTKAVVIPYDVTNINARAFFKSWNVTSFSFEETPEGKTEVDLKINDAASNSAGAFHQFIGITTLALPNRLTYIGDYGFYNCSMLHTLTIDLANSKLKHIGKYAFAKCNGLSIIVIPSSTEKICEYAFAECTRITSLTFDDADNSKLLEIGDCAFASTSFSVIRIPNTVTTLGESLFKDGRVTTVYLPSKLSEMNPATFAGCDSISAIYLENNAKYYIEESVVYNAAKTELLFYPIGKKSESYSIVPGVTKINAGAFEGNTYIRNVTIPNSVTTIEAGAFYGCTNLATVDFIPDNDTTKNTELNIGDTSDEKGVFENCTNLTTVNLPQRTVRLGKNLFSNCSSLSQLTIHERAAFSVINANVFTNAGGGRLTLPSTVTTIKSNAFSGSLFTEIVMSNVQTIEDNAFNGSNVSSVVLPETLSSIGISAFASCENLTTVEIKLNTTTPLTITTTTTTTVSSTNGAKGTFANCLNLTTVSISTNGTLPYFMFYNCSKLTNLTVTGQATISGYLCRDLSGLKKVSLGEGVKSIGVDSFRNCVNLGSHNENTCTDEDCKGDAAHGFTFTAATKTTGLTSIGNYAFYGTSIKSFVMPDTVTSVGTYLFEGNTALNSVTIPTKAFASLGDRDFYGCTSLSSVTFVDKGAETERKLVTIGVNTFGMCSALTSIDLTGFTTINSSAFLGSGLKSVVIPSSVTSLASQAFQDCGGLLSAQIPTDSFVTLNSMMFKNCDHLATVTFVGTGENKLTTIASNAFEGCTLLSAISFHTGLTTINDNAFLNSGLTRITISSTVSDIKSKAFAGCNITSITVDGNSGAYAISDDNKALLSKDKTVLKKYIGSATEYTIPDGIITIGDYAFQDSAIQKILSTSDVETISQYAFAGCESLQSIVMEKVKTIGTYAFASCTSLQSIDFGDELEEIGSSAFQNCGAVDVELPDSLTTLGTYAFANSAITGVTFGSGLTELPSYAFDECASLSSVEIPSTITKIGSYTFRNNGLQTVTFNAGLETIESCAFAGCGDLGNFVIPSTVTAIKDGAFMDCASITAITIPVNVNSLGKAVFAGCTELSDVTISASTDRLVITSGTATTAGNVGRGIFASCPALESIDLSKRPIYVGTTASAVPTIPNYIFYGCENLQTVKFHDDTTTLGSYAFQNCLNLSNVTLPSSLTTINTYAFRDSGISNITLPEGLITIGSYAFMDCKLLEGITIPGTVKTINSAAFAGCLLLESVIFEADDGSTGLGFASGSVSLSFSPTSSVTSRGVFGGCISLKSVDLSTRSKIYNSATLTSATYENRLANYIFADCTALQSVTLPDNMILIGTASFYNSGLTSFTIGANIESINNAAFAECSNLVTVDIKGTEKKLGIAYGSNITSVSSFGVFYNCTSLKSIDLSTRSAIYCSATTSTAAYKALGNYTFYGCSLLKSVKLPNDLQLIGSYSFYDCESLVSINIPTNTKYIGNNAFYNSGLVNVVIPDNVVNIGESAFRKSKDLVSVQLPDQLNRIYKYAFMDCTSLKSLYLPAGIEFIGNAAFAGCTGLEKIEFEESASPLGFASGLGADDTDRGVFADCTALKTIDLSNINVRRMWYTTYTLSTSATLPTTSTLITNFPASSIGYSYSINSAMPEYMFHGCTGLESVVLSNVMWFGGGYSGDKSRDDKVFANCTSLKNVTFPTDVDFRLGDSSFENCGFETLTLPSNLAGMGSDAFANCKKLTKLVVEDNTVCTWLRGFSGCEMLSEVVLPDTLTGLNYRVFENCASLKSITLPDNLEYIDSYAFQNTGLESVTIPAGIRVYSNVFEGCKQLESVTIEGALDNLGWHVFENCTALTSVTLKEGFDDVMNYMFAGCTSLTSITLPNTVEYISSHAFDGCTSLVSIEIPNSVFFIGEFAFAGCTSLTSIVIPETVTEIRDYAFEGWTSAQTIYIVTLTEAPEGWSTYWNWNSKQVDVTPEPEEPSEDDEEDVERVYETQPDKPCDATVVWGYVVP